MKIKNLSSRILICIIALMLIAPMEVISQEGGTAKVFKQEELDQMLAPIALYPDSLLTQVLMASTCPLEVVQSDRWAKQNKAMKGDALAKLLKISYKALLYKITAAGLDAKGDRLGQRN